MRAETARTITDEAKKQQKKEELLREQENQREYDRALGVAISAAEKHLPDVLTAIEKEASRGHERYVLEVFGDRRDIPNEPDRDLLYGQQMAVALKKLGYRAEMHVEWQPMSDDGPNYQFGHLEVVW